jgi:hypothetical protein
VPDEGHIRQAPSQPLYLTAQASLVEDIEEWRAAATWLEECKMEVLRPVRFGLSRMLLH